MIKNVYKGTRKWHMIRTGNNDRVYGGSPSLLVSQMSMNQKHSALDKEATYKNSWMGNGLPICLRKRRNSFSGKP